MNKVELKKVQFSERMSEETYCFSADIYFNGKNIGYCENRGHGGSTDVHCNPKVSKKDWTDFVNYAKSLPPYMELSDGRVIAMNEEHLCDELFDKWIEVKNADKVKKKFTKDMGKGIVYNDKPTITNSWGLYKWNVDLATVIAKRPDLVKKAIKELKAEGNYILNTNIPQELM